MEKQRFMVGACAFSMFAIIANGLYIWHLQASKPAGQPAFAAQIKPDAELEPGQAIAQTSDQTPDVCGQPQPTRTTSFSSIDTITVRVTTAARIRTKPTTVDDQTIVGFVATGRTIQVKNSIHFVGNVPWFQTADNRWIAANLVEVI